MSHILIKAAWRKLSMCRKYRRRRYGKVPFVPRRSWPFLCERHVSLSLPDTLVVVVGESIRHSTKTSTEGREVYRPSSKYLKKWRAWDCQHRKTPYDLQKQPKLTVIRSSRDKRQASVSERTTRSRAISYSRDTGASNAMAISIGYIVCVAKSSQFELFYITWMAYTSFCRAFFNEKQKTPRRQQGKNFAVLIRTRNTKFKSCQTRKKDTIEHPCETNNPCQYRNNGW